MLLATVCVFALFQFSGRIGHGNFDLYPAYDFGIFYCAGKALHNRADPYAVEPLRTCEKRVERSGYLPDVVAEPAPLPGYSLAIFALLSLAPFWAAKAAWLIIECVALVVSAVLLARMTRLRTVAVFAILFLADAMLSITWGQLPPIAIAALICSAYFLRKERYWPAAVAAAIALIEPQLGLPAVLGVLIFVPRGRAAMGICLALIGATHVAVLGWPLALQYFTDVLPGQALSEVTAADQFSFTWFAHYFGAPDSLATRAGTISYGIMLIVGLAAAARIARKLADQAVLVLLPTAIVLVGGSYEHQIQIAAALPAALLIGCSFQGRMRVLFLATAAALAVPWFSALDSRLLLIASPLALFCFVAFGWPEPRLVKRLELGVSAALLCVLVLAGLRTLPIGAAQPSPTPPQTVTQRSLASASWESFIRSDPALSSSGPRVLVPKLPTWGALLFFSFACAALAFAYRAPDADLATGSG